MKKISLGLIIFFIFGLLFKLNTFETTALEYKKTDPGSDPRCLQIKVTFNADSQWRENGNKRYIMAGCDGQGALTNPKHKPFPGCTGGLVKIKPGETATLGRCSCFFQENPPGGCLKIGKELTIEDKKTGWRKRREVKVVKPLRGTEECSVKVTNGKGKVLTPNNKFEFMCATNEQKKKVNVNINCEEKECPGPQQVTGVKVECPNCKETESEAQE